MRIAPERRKLAGCLAVLALALVVAAAIKRQPADFSALPPLVLVRDRQQHTLWAIRVAAASHQIAVEAVAAPPLPEGRAYQLWLSGPNGARSLGLLPEAGRRIIPEMPAPITRLDAGHGMLEVTLEPARGSVTEHPSGPVMFRSALAGGPGR
jgi:anti-sigma-K factor RskA